MSHLRLLFFFLLSFALATALPLSESQSNLVGTCHAHAKLSGKTDIPQTDLSVQFYGKDGNDLGSAEKLFMEPGDSLVVPGGFPSGQNLKFTYLLGEQTGQKTQTYWPLVMKFGAQTWYPSDKQCKVGGFDHKLLGQSSQQFDCAFAC
ncbi:hypothetical protein MMC20_004240 [Loxospora ochrophaea]|nr:hypothetical protein [Loxospora ochrophaea]